jgi:hypothetical protein
VQGPRNLVPDDLLAQKNVSTIEEIRRKEPACADHGCATIIRHACTPTERPPGGQMAQCVSLHGAMRFAYCALRFCGVTRGLDHASRIYPTCALKVPEIG